MPNKLDVKFGVLDGDAKGTTVGMAASAVVKNASSRFVTASSGNAAIAGATASLLLGFVDVGEQTCSSTAGATIATLYRNPAYVYRIPLKYDGSTYTVNYSAACIGCAFDFVVLSNVQYINLTLSTYNPLVVVGGQAASSTTAGDGYCDVIINPSMLAVS